jgi:hypothetical protein
VTRALEPTPPEPEATPVDEREAAAVRRWLGGDQPRQDIEDIRLYPHRQPIFDRRFGPGAAARVLQGVR